MVFRSTIRSFINQPGFVLIAVGTLALGIAAATSIFSVIESVVLRPLPYGDPDRLVVVWSTENEDVESNVSGANLIDWQDQNQSFDGIGAFTPVLLTRTDHGDPERLSGLEVTPRFFEVMAVDPHLGRAFSTEASDAQAAILSYEYWERTFGVADDAIGRRMTLNDRTYTVIGVAPRGFEIPFEDADVWTRSPKRAPTPPIDLGVEPDALRGLNWLRAIGRLKAGVSLEEAQADLSLVAKRLEEAYPDDNAGRGVRIVPLHEQVSGDVKPALVVLFGAVGMLMLIGCANVASLLLARAAGREKEIAVRAALGASRGRIVMELLVESVGLALLGGVLGLVLSRGLTHWILIWGPSWVFRLDNVSLNPVVFGFAVAASLATGLVFGILPAIQTSRPELASALKEGGRQSVGTSRKRMRSALVVVEVALALILLVVSGLLARSFIELRQVDPGFDTSEVLTMRLWMPDSRYDEPAKIARAYDDILERLSGLSGVASVSGVLGVPLSGTSASFGVVIEGREPEPPGEELSVGFQSVAPGYFRTMGIPLLRGRDFSRADDADGALVSAVSVTTAERHWPGEDPIGGRFSQDGETWFEVVAIVGDVLHDGLDQEPRAEVYVPYPQTPFPLMTIVLKSRADAASLAARARREVLAVDPALPIYRVMPLDEIVSASVAEPRFNTFLLGLFAATAIALAAIGLYGLMAYNVSQRRREIGIRVALGAETRDVVSLVLAEGFVLTLMGLLLGLGGALFASRLVASFLFQITTHDGATYAGVAFVLLAAALLASTVPARRACRVDPLTALRHE